MKIKRDNSPKKMQVEHKNLDYKVIVYRDQVKFQAYYDKEKAVYGDAEKNITIKFLEQLKDLNLMVFATTKD